MKLEHQMQPTGNTCMVTSVAVLIGMPVAEAVERYHEEMYNGRALWYDDILEEHDIPYEFGHPKYPRLKTGNVYCVTVPSLNQDCSHALIVDKRGPKMIVLDPNKGREGKLFYGEGGAELTTWYINVCVPGSVYEA